MQLMVWRYSTARAAEAIRIAGFRGSCLTSPPVTEWLPATAPDAWTWTMNMKMPDIRYSMKSPRMGELRTPMTR